MTGILDPTLQWILDRLNFWKLYFIVYQRISVARTREEISCLWIIVLDLTETLACKYFDWFTDSNQLTPMIYLWTSNWHMVSKRLLLFCEMMFVVMTQCSFISLPAAVIYCLKGLLWILSYVWWLIQLKACSYEQYVNISMLCMYLIIKIRIKVVSQLY